MSIFNIIYLVNVRAHGKYGRKVRNIDNLQLMNTEVSEDEVHEG